MSHLIQKYYQNLTHQKNRLFKKIGYSIAPGNAYTLAKKYADYVTERHGGDRAVTEACLHVLEKFFEPFDPETLPESKQNTSEEWTV